MPTDEGGGGGDDVFTPLPVTGRRPHRRGAADRQAARISTLAASGRSAHDGLVGEGHWSGPAASAFSGFARSTDRLCVGAEQPLGTVAKAAGTYADALETAQRAIREAKAAYDAAQHRADAEAASVNADPDATPADVHAAQGRIDTARSEASRRAPTRGRPGRRTTGPATRPPGAPASATEEVEGEVEESPVKRIIESAEPYTRWNEKFDAVWDLVVADKALEASSTSPRPG